MTHPVPTPHDVRLASFDGERAVLLALWDGLVQLSRHTAGLLGRCFAAMPGPQSLH